jgi:hypothetical protein
MLQRRNERNPFQAYVDPKSKTKAEIRPPEVKHFQFVVVLVDDTNPQEVPSILSKVINTLVRQRANVPNVSSSLLVGLLGVPFPESNSPQARRELVDALLQDNGDRIRIAHGECDGAVGMFGSHERWAYSAVIPGFSAALKMLLETKFGTAVEIS